MDFQNSYTHYAVIIIKPYKWAYKTRRHTNEFHQCGYLSGRANTTRTCKTPDSKMTEPSKHKYYYHDEAKHRDVCKK